MSSCSACGAAVESGFAFCPRCGRKLPAPCASCGTACAPDFAFCPTCGARLGAPPAEPSGAREAPPEEGDRRVVTVLFADVSGFTALGERLDPEEVRAFQNDLFQELSSAIERYDGFAEKFVGDAVMAVFGAPRAHEDDPERALRAALRMHERAAALDRRWQARLGQPLALHIGVNTGGVVAGALGTTGGGAYAVTGDTVNTAARLQSAAAPGQTLVSAATQRLTQHAFRFEPVGELTMKGKAQPVQGYRVVDVQEAPGGARGLAAHGLAAPMVGRDDELAQMVAAFERTLRGHAQIVSLIGEAGIGKSRLLAEFLAALDAEGRLAGVTLRRAVCSSLGGQPFGIFATFCHDAFGVEAGDPLDVTEQKLATGLTPLGGGEEAALIAPLLEYVLGVEAGDRFRHVEPEQRKRQIFLALRRMMERRLEQGPLVLVVEDLHWADAVSVEVLSLLVDRLADRQILLVTTSRPSFDVRALVGTLAAHTALRLTPLTGADGEALFRAWFGPSADRLPGHLRTLVLGRAGGHPLYLEEIVRSLIGSDVLVREGDGWRLAGEAATIDVPPTVHGLLLARVDRVPADARRLLQEASVLGSIVDASLLREVASAPATLDIALDRLLESGLLAEATRPGREDRAYRFTQALLHDVVYQSLLVRRRTALHEHVGRVLEAVVGDAPRRLEDLESLAYHWSRSGDKRKGARYLVAAGDRARGLYANDDALRHYERALASLAESESGEDEQWPVRERLGDLLGPMGRRDAALAHHEAVLAGLAAAGDPSGQARLHRKLARLHWDGGDRAAALARLQAGLVLLEGRREDVELAHLYEAMGRLAFRGGDNLRAIEWAERALDHAERLAATAGDAADPVRERECAAVIAQASNTLGVAFARTGRLREAVGRIERSVTVAEGHDLLQAACRGYTNLGVLYSTLDPRRSIETCLRGLEMARRIGDLGFQSRLNTNLAVAYCALTNRCEEQGVSAAEAALELDRQLGYLDHLAVPLIVLGQIQQCHGDPGLALRYYREALEIAERTGEPQLLFPCYDGLATLYLDRGEEAQAEEFMSKAQAVCERAGLDPDSLLVLPFLE